MSGRGTQPLLVIAEDDDDDFLLIKDAFARAGAAHEIRWVKNGEELMGFLLERRDGGQPVVVLLDLNMPRKDGREVLRELKSHPSLRGIPVIILTTSQAQEDIDLCYDLGVCSYIRKPANFSDLVEAAALFERYWMEFVKLPSGAGRRPSVPAP